MSVNKREEVLTRLLDILNDPALVPDINSCVRNRGLLSNEQLPGIIMLDGDETSRKLADDRGRQRMSPVITVLHPQIFIVLKNKKPKNVDVGTELNTYRGAIIKAISADAQLLALIGPNGDITYDGCETDLKTGMPMEGEMMLAFSIACVLNPNA